MDVNVGVEEGPEPEPESPPHALSKVRKLSSHRVRNPGKPRLAPPDGCVVRVRFIRNIPQMPATIGLVLLRAIVERERTTHE
jgi:hypothetical protein